MTLNNPGFSCRNHFFHPVNLHCCCTLVPTLPIWHYTVWCIIDDLIANHKMWVTVLYLLLLTEWQTDSRPRWGIFCFHWIYGDNATTEQVMMVHAIPKIPLLDCSKHRPHSARFHLFGQCMVKYMPLHKRHFKSAIVLNSVVDTVVMVCKLYMNSVIVSFCNAVKWTQFTII